MNVKRIVRNVDVENLELADRFYGDALGLDLLMDQGWIRTYGSKSTMALQISVASQGGSNTPTPDLSIEVDDLDEAYKRMHDGGFSIEYGPSNEPWGVRRFFVRDPYGQLVNILTHL